MAEAGGQSMRQTAFLFDSKNNLLMRNRNCKARNIIKFPFSDHKGED